MSGVSLVLLGFIGFWLTWLLIPAIQHYLRDAGRRQLHHTHSTPIPRFGGLALAISFVAVAALASFFYSSGPFSRAEAWTITGAPVAMFLLGFLDDLKPLGAKRKLAGQIAIAAGVYFAGIQIGSIQNPLTGAKYVLGAWGCLATIFWLVAFTNLINLIDGVDGLAGGISLMVMSLLLYVGWRSGLTIPLVCAAAVCGALLAFLRYNFPPAKIYLGDGGAYFLGFLIGLLAMVNSQKGTVVAALIAPLFVLALPIVDVTLAIVRRGLKGVPIFRPDQRHLHHRLADSGLSRTRVVLLFYAGSLIFLALGFAVFVSKGKLLPLVFGLSCLVLLLAARSFSFSRDWFSVGKVLGNSLEMRRQVRYALLLGEWLELEAERLHPAEELWNDFTFLAGKLGFAAVTLSSREGRWHWRAPGWPGCGQPKGKRYDLPNSSALEFAASAELDDSAVDLLSDLAAEIWLKSTDRWQEVNKVSFNFAHRRDGVALSLELPSGLAPAQEG